MKFHDIINKKPVNMQFPYLEASKASTSFNTKFQGFQNSSNFTPPILLYPSIYCYSNGNNRNPSKSANRKVNHSSPRTRVLKEKGKENVWSVDNEFAKVSDMAANERANRKKKEGKSVMRKRSSNGGGGKVLVSGAMLVELETVLQTQVPVIRPAWNTFSSSVSGIWKGVGAVFSPINAEMEPIDVGEKNKYLYDCYTLAWVNAVPSSSRESTPVIKRKINWVTLNPNGEIQPKIEVNKSLEGHVSEESVLINFNYFDLEGADLMEEDYMGTEPGLVYFEDGSYSRGPVEIPVEVDEFGNCLSQTLKFEQCLVKGCHKRLRIVHTIEFNNGGSDIQIMRVAVYEEQWAGPANVPDQSESEFDSKPFSQRKRIKPSQLTGQWKVFEISATPIYGDETSTEESNEPTFVYLCMETLKKRSLPEPSVYFREEEMLDMQDTTVLWLTGGVTSYVDVDKDGILCIGVGWYSDEGINLVMERDYDVDGKLKDVRSKTELKRRWSDPLFM